jgi:RHH-type rel operon transcriptional repressor/antitoxin RelB
MSVSVSLRLPDRTAKVLEDLSRSLDRSKTYLIQKALENWMADQADYQMALDRLRDKDDAIISSATMRKRLGHKN